MIREHQQQQQQQHVLRSDFEIPKQEPSQCPQIAWREEGRAPYIPRTTINYTMVVTVGPAIIFQIR